VRARRYTFAVWSALVAWGALLFVAVRDDYEGYRLGSLDLGGMAQAVWSTAHGRPFEATSLTGDQVSRLGGHVDPILALLAPLWLLIPSPLTLAAAQIAAVALGALPVYWLGRRHLLSEPLGFLCAVAYLLSPWLTWTALDAIHPVTFAIPLFLLCIWLLDEGRLGLFVGAAVLVAACGELMGLTIAALGIWYALARGRRREGIGIAVGGIAATSVALFLVVPAFSSGQSQFFGFYEAVGGSPKGMIETVLTDPGAIVGQLFDADVLLFVLALAAPLGGLFVFAPGLAVVGLPQLLVNALADPVGPIDPRQHYLAAIVPFLVAGTVLGIARLRPTAQAPAVLTVVGLSVALSILFGPWAGGQSLGSLWYQEELSASHVRALDSAVALVPPNAPVSVSNRVGAHLAARRRLYQVPNIRRAEWVVLDTQDLWLPDARLPVLSKRSPSVLEALRRRIEGLSEWKLVRAEDGVYVFRRVTPAV